MQDIFCFSLFHPELQLQPGYILSCADNSKCVAPKPAPTFVVIMGVPTGNVSLAFLIIILN